MTGQIDEIDAQMSDTLIHREYAEFQLGGVQAFDVLDIAHEEGLALKEQPSEVTEAESRHSRTTSVRSQKQTNYAMTWNSQRSSSTRTHPRANTLGGSRHSRCRIHYF